MALDAAPDLDAVADRLLDAAKRRGADAADVLVSQSESLGVSARAGALEDAERSESIDFGLRVILGEAGGVRQALVSASDAAPDAIEQLAERAVAMAKAAPPDPYARLADPQDLATDLEARIAALELADPDDAPSAEALLEQALELEAAALAVSGVTQAEGAGAGWSRGRILLATSHGFRGAYAGGSHSISVSAVAGTGVGMERDYAFSAARRRTDLRAIAEIGQEAGERAVRRLNPRKPKTGKYPVVYEPRMAAGLAGALLSAANGASVARGSSFLKDKMGERILPEGVSLEDDPLRPRGLASKPFDGEGVTTRAKTIIEGGVLAAWLLDTATAAQLGLATNGCASRGVGGAPSPSASNAWLTAGAQSPEALIGEIESGLYITEMMGGGFNLVTGDYSRGAAGFWIENGALAYPVSEITVAGDALEIFQSLTPADDLTFERRVTAPTTRVEGLTIAAD